MKTAVRLILCFMLSFTMVELPMMKSAHAAGMISTSSAIELMNRADHQAKVVNFLSRADVQKQLIQFGVTADEAFQRISSLTDAELRDLTKEIDNGTAAGGLEGVLILVILVLLIIYLFKRV
jgi:hypothetical protein